MDGTRSGTGTGTASGTGTGTGPASALARRWTRIGLRAALALAAARTAAAQDRQEVTVRGVVITADAAPISGVRVVLEVPGAASRDAATDEEGAFTFAHVGARGTLRLRRIGFQPDSVALGFDGRDPAPLTLVLAPVPQALAPVFVHAPAAIGPLADFYRRRATGQGRFIARADIEKRKPFYTTDLLRSVPGLSLMRSGSSMLLRFRGSSCAPEVYVDGTPLGPAELDFDAFSPGTLEGIEIYSGTSTVPPQFARSFGRTACGTVLLWSREGDRRPRSPKKNVVSADSLAALIASAQVFTEQQVDSAAQLSHDFADDVRVPVALGEWTAPATVVAEFVVDAQGHVEPMTINVVASTGPGFGDAVRTALPTARFLPALRGGHAVRQFTQLSVVLDPERVKR